MHEISLCESLLDIIGDCAKRDGFTRVRRIVLEIGPFAGVEISALRFGFEAVSKRTLAEGAVLESHESQGQAWCFECSQTVPIQGRLDTCPLCGGGRLQPSQGMEMKIKELEVI